jgi:hypothetical protein
MPPQAYCGGRPACICMVSYLSVEHEKAILPFSSSHHGLIPAAPAN